MQPDLQMPAASLLLLPLERLRRLIRSVLALLPFLLRPSPLAPRLSPLALPLPRFVPRLPTFALSPLAFLAIPSNHRSPRHRPTQRRAPGMAGPTRSQSSRPIAPQTQPKSAPRPPKSFLEKTLTAREAPKVARFSRSRQQPSTGSVRRLLLPRWKGTGCAVEAAQPRQPADRPRPSAPKHPLSSQEPARLAVEAAQPRASADRPWRPAVNQDFPRPELERRAVEAAQPRPLADRPWRRLSAALART